MPLNYSFSNLRHRLHRRLKPNAPATGRIDKIDADGFICGWAFERRGVRSRISVVYKGRAIGIFSANLYRRDLELAGVGDAHHAFRIPIPDDPDHFDIEALVISFVHGKSLERGILLRQWAAVDLLSSPVTPHVHLELTSRCNLRCVYCAVSQPGYQGSDFPLANLEYLIEQMKVRGTTSIAVNGHGETTFIPQWFRATNLFADAGFSLALTSNFARRFEADELSAMAHMSFITVSLDTYDQALLKKLRRKVDLETILENMEKIREMARASHLPEPKFSWSCVLSDAVALHSLEYVKFGLSVGIKDFIFCNLVEYGTPPGAYAVHNVATLGYDELVSLKEQLEQSEFLIREVGGTLVVTGDLAEIIASGAIKEH